MTPHDQKRTDLLKQELARLEEEYRARCKPIVDELIRIANCYAAPIPLSVLQMGDLHCQIVGRSERKEPNND